MRKLAVGIAGVVVVAVTVAAWAQHQHGVAKPATAPARCDMKGGMDSAIKTIDQAIAAVENGHKDAALAALKQAKATLQECQEHCLAQAGGAGSYANTNCPTMGGKIDPAKVTPALTRTFNGKTIAFCCGGCPGAWDKLSDQEKQAKLAKVTPASSQPAPSAGHMQHMNMTVNSSCCGGCQ